MAKVNKYYAVRKGSVPGIYRSWDECKYSISGFPNPEFKSFSTLEEAEAFMEGRSMTITHVIDNPDHVIAYTDGSFSPYKNEAGYGVIIITQDGEDELFGIARINNEPYPELRQIVGELVAVMEVVKYCRSRGYTKVTIYYDYIGVAHWAQGSWSANNIASQTYQKFMMNCDISVDFIKVPAHTNNVYNEKADQAAKKGLGLIQTMKFKA